MRHKFVLKISSSLLAVLVAGSVASAQTVVPTKHHHASPQQATSVVLVPTAAAAPSANSQLVQALASARTLLATATRNHQCRTMKELMTEVHHWLKKRDRELQCQ